MISTTPENGTLSLTITIATGHASDVSLIVNSQDVSKHAGGTITPLVMKTPVSVTNFEQSIQRVPKDWSFDWRRKLDAGIGAPETGNTYLALLATDHKDAKAHIIIPKVQSTAGNFTAWNPVCADDGHKVEIRGSTTFAVAGMSQAQVVTAMTEALSISLDVSPQLITLNVSSVRRLQTDQRRLQAPTTWTVAYAVTVPESKSAAVNQAANTISNDPTGQAAFKADLETALSNAEGSGTQFTVVLTDFSTPTEGCVTNCDTATSAPEGVVTTDGAASQWLSSLAGLLIAAALTQQA
jgi:hypothetical protein